MVSAVPENEALYRQVSQKVEGLIRAGTWRPGERIPSVRQASRQHGVSITTVLQAYLALEDQGLIEARPKSGFFVRASLRPVGLPAEPEVSRPPRMVTEVTVGALQSRLFEASRLPGIMPLGGAAPAPELLPMEKLNRCLAGVARRHGRKGVAYDLPPGAESLRREIARRAVDAGANLAPDEIITTSGGTEALMLALRAVTRPGDVVAVESPAYFGVLHALEELRLHVVGIPMHPRTGMDLDALEQVLAQQRVAACVSVPNFSNPLGSLMPDEHKQRLIEMLGSREIPLIEDDIFGELHFGPQRPRVALAYDRKGLVLLCSSFSKTLAPGYRVGWIVPGRFYRQVQTLKLTSTLATATLPELAVAEFLANGGYDHYLRSIRRTYADNVARFSAAVAASFPEPVTLTRPEGGFVLWVELPPGVDALRLDDLALHQKISIAPGPMFSPEQGLRNFIRLSCAVPWSPKVERAVSTLGRLANQLTGTR